MINRMTFWILLALVSFSELSMGATWQRHVINSDRFDNPGPHPLAYFTQYPRLFQLDPCEGCTSEQRSAQAKDMNFMAQVERVGTLEGFAIYDVFYTMTGERNRWKSILVRTGQDEYREIYHTESFGPAGGSPESAEIVNVGKEQLLRTRCWEGPRSYEDDHWFFDTAGPTIIDFRPIVVRARSVLPKGHKLSYYEDENIPGTHYLWNFDNPGLRSTLWVLKPDEQYCCTGGKIDVSFKFDRGRVIVTRTTYDHKARTKM